ncbi:uncharacterized protein VTP21DRAFT_9757 [Calcarisporiella thermophila]|uniref:uncharacterized protein n=1 Tax=Calcarisporiella thermophila TaxID=911321 RepID=UPI0037449B2F
MEKPNSISSPSLCPVALPSPPPASSHAATAAIPVQQEMYAWVTRGPPVPPRSSGASSATAALAGLTHAGAVIVPTIALLIVAAVLPLSADRATSFDQLVGWSVGHSIVMALIVSHVVIPLHIQSVRIWGILHCRTRGVSAERVGILMEMLSGRQPSLRTLLGNPGHEPEVVAAVVAYFTRSAISAGASALTTWLIGSVWAEFFARSRLEGSKLSDPTMMGLVASDIQAITWTIGPLQVVELSVLCGAGVAICLLFYCDWALTRFWASCPWSMATAISFDLRDYIAPGSCANPVRSHLVGGNRFYLSRQVSHGVGHVGLCEQRVWHQWSAAPNWGTRWGAPIPLSCLNATAPGGRVGPAAKNQA